MGTGLDLTDPDHLTSVLFVTLLIFMFCTCVVFIDYLYISWTRRHERLLNPEEELQICSTNRVNS
jgi:hypothetical protein